MIKIKYLILVLGILSLMIAGCGSRSTSTPSNTKPIPTPNPGKATVTGKIFSTITNKPLNTSVWLAEVHRQAGQGVYVLDAVNSPGIYANDQGIFVLANVTPQEYVIVVGDPEGANEVITDETGKPKVWTVSAGQVLDTGELQVKLAK